MKFGKDIYDTILQNNIENQPIMIQGSIFYLYARWQPVSIVRNSSRGNPDHKAIANHESRIKTPLSSVFG